MQPQSTQPPVQPTPGPQAADPHGHQDALNDFITMSRDIAHVLHGQVMAHAQPAPGDTAAHPAPPPGPAIIISSAAAFDQMARAARRCIALSQSLNAPKQHPAALPAQPPAPDRTTARQRIIRAVEDVIQRPPDNDECDDPEVLLSDFRERLDTPDLDAEIGNRPVEDIIKDILRDLGLAALPGSRPWKRRTPADIADLNASAAAPTSPARSTTPPPNPQNGNPTAAHPAPNPAAPRDSGHPAAPARPPVRPGDTLPTDPAEAVAFILHHHARTDVRWRPPPGD